MTVGGTSIGIRNKQREIKIFCLFAYAYPSKKPK
jgi:hypothetical protein